MGKQILTLLRTETQKLEQAGLLRQELALQAPPGPTITIGGKVLSSFATGDYLGLATDASMKRAAKAAIDEHGVGLAAPRAVTGTLPVHLQLEDALTQLLKTEASLVFPSGYHANTGLFESLLGERDYVFCDEQIHASLADGLRLSRARVFSYRTGDIDHLEDRLRRSRAARFRAIVTDGVFPLEGSCANLRAITDLAARYDALVIVDDAQGIGVLGESGRGTHEQLGVIGKLDVVTGSFANALGGGAGGFASGRREIVAWLRQKSRPHLVSTALPAAAAAAARRALEVVDTQQEARAQLRAKAARVRRELGERGFRVVAGEHPIIAVVLGDAVATQRFADLLFRKGVFAMGFCHPVVPEGAARIRLQISVAHGDQALGQAIEAFAETARELRLPAPS